MINVSKLYCGLPSEGDDLRYSPGRHSGPVVVFNCTYRCNLNCRHCYSWSQGCGTQGQLSTAQSKNLLGQLAEAKCPVVLFSGGEPLCRSDIFELLREARRLGLRSALSTNGTLIDEAAADELASAGLGYAGISIDGSQAVHDSFRRVQGSFEAALAGIKNCRSVGVKTGLRFTITRANKDEIPVVFDIAASMSVRRICFYHLIRTGRAKHLKSQFLTPQQSRQAVDMILAQTKESVSRGDVDEVLTVGNHCDGPYLLIKLAAEDGRSFEQAKALLQTNGGNRVGENIACVSWDGNVYADQFWRNYSLGNVKEQSFGQIWQNDTELVLARLRNKGLYAAERCRRCKWFDLCRGNFRFLDTRAENKHWLNEPPCYLSDEEMADESIVINAGRGLYQ